VRVIESILGSPCVSCGADARYPLGAGGLCAECLDDLPWIGAPRCVRCGRPLAIGSSLCLVCREGDFRFDACRSLWANSGSAKALLRAFKYGRDLRALDLIGPALGKLAEEEGWTPRGDRKGGPFIVPVPADPRRRRLRGWDPVERLARSLGGKPVRALAKEGSAEQKRLGARKRLEEGRGGMGIRAIARLDGDILLVDDVVTTGATLSACAAALKEAGAARVGCLTVVREL